MTLKIAASTPHPERRLAGRFAVFLEDVFQQHREGPQRVRAVMTDPVNRKSRDDRVLLVCLDAEPTAEQVDSLVEHLRQWKAP